VTPAASALAQALSSPPTFSSFFAASLLAALALAAGAFALRRTPALAALRRALDGLVLTLLAAALLAMVALSAAQILVRNVFESGFLWIDPLLRQLVLVLAILGGLVATGRKRHIQVSLLERFVSGRARRIAGCIVALVALAICLSVVHASLLLLRDELAAGERGIFGIPSWIILLAFPVGFSSLGMRFAYLAFLESTGESPQRNEIEDVVASSSGAA
jgi:TRAP-type C4-dicarboxylate transport system permease small subunit